MWGCLDDRRVQIGKSASIRGCVLAIDGESEEEEGQQGGGGRGRAGNPQGPAGAGRSEGGVGGIYVTYYP